MKNKICLIGFCLIVTLKSFSLAAPAIINDEVVTLSDDTAIITWQTTSEASTGKITYGLTLPVSTITTESSSQNYHYLAIGNLFPNTTYYYRITSTSTTGTAETTIKSFKTLDRPGGNYLFTFATVTDLHYRPSATTNTKDIRGRPYASSEVIINALLDAIKVQSPSFVIVKGDLIDLLEAAPEASAAVLAGKFTSRGLTAYPIPGNHDKGLTYAGAGKNWVTANLGLVIPTKAGLPTGNSTFNYSFVQSGYRFIMLDSAWEKSSTSTSEVKVSSLETELIAAKAAKQKAFVFLHDEVSEEADIPTDVLMGVLDQTTWEASDWDKIRIKNHNAFFTTLEAYKLDNSEYVVGSVFMGHLHDSRKRDLRGFRCVRTSSGLQFPTGYNIYKVYSNGYIQSFYKLKDFSDPIARDCVSGEGQVTQSRAQQFYLGGLADRNFTYTYSAQYTITSPEVKTIQPAGGATSVALNQPIIINFTKPMAGDTTVNSWLTVSGQTFDSSKWSWNSDKTQLTLNLSFSASTAYTVTVKSTAAATDGTTFGADYASIFTTGTASSTTAPTAEVTPLKNENGQVTNVTTDTTPTFSGVATDESGSTIANVQFRYASSAWSGWYPATPTDGTFNSATEQFYFTITNEVAVGEHEVQILTTNSAGVTKESGYATYAFYVISGRPLITLKADGSEIINGDPINPTPSLEVKVITDQTLNSLTLNIDGKATDIKPATVGYVNSIYTKPTLAAGTHTIKIEAIDQDSLGAQRASTKEAVSLVVQTSGDQQVFGPPLANPNPFTNIGTGNITLSYVLSKNSDVILSIHDLTGTIITKINKSSGTNGGRAGYNTVEWDGKGDNGNHIGNGIYIYLILCDGKVAAQGKLTVIKR